MSIYEQDQDKKCGNCLYSMGVTSEKYRVVCDVHPAVFNVVGCCSKWEPELEPEKPQEPEQMDEKSRESWLRVGELLVERLKTINAQQETIDKLRWRLLPSDKELKAQKEINERLRKKIDHICRAIFASYEDYR